MATTNGKADARFPGSASIVPDPGRRRRKYHAFDIETTSSAGFTVPWRNPWTGSIHEVYGNANLSIYSAAACNGQCPFCVERVRPAASGQDLARVKGSIDDDTYFNQLQDTLDAVAPLRPSLSITGGEPSIDPRLPRILELVAGSRTRKRTMTTNASGLLPNNLVPALAAAGFSHLNISRSHFDEEANQATMQLDRFVSNDEIGEIIRRATDAGIRPRLSCVLVDTGISTRERIEAYLEWALDIGVDNVVFRQLMGFDPVLAAPVDPVLAYSSSHRVAMDPLLPGPEDDAFTFTTQVVGYYYYVEVFTYKHAVDVVFENADMAVMRDVRARRDTIHELVFHPGGTLNDSWLPWQGILSEGHQGTRAMPW